MKRLCKSNRVLWAPAFNLSQVRVFLSEESPSKLGMKYQNDVHANPSIMLHSNVAQSNDLPPGFENNHMVSLKEPIYHIPLVKWKCPPKFAMSSNWQVVSGEESEEVVVQKLREMRVMYPHNSNIPPCPVVSIEGHDEGYDDHFIPVIPIIPVEEEEVLETPPDLKTPDITTPVSSLPPAFLPQASLLPSKTTSPGSESLAKEKPVLGIPLGLGSDDITTALATAMKSNEIDTELLVQIFSDPKMIEKLTKDGGAAPNTVSMDSAPVYRLKQATRSVSPTTSLKPATQPIPLGNSKPTMVPPQRSENGKVDHVTSGKQPVFSNAPAQLAKRSVTIGSKLVNQLATRPGQEHNVGPLPVWGSENKVNLIPKPPVKDERYYKNLIRQHGGDDLKSEKGGYHNLPNNQYHNLEMMQKLSTGEVKPRSQKACVYYNSTRGCRNGANCIFKHEITYQKRGSYGFRVNDDEPNVKRMRLGNQIQWT